MEYIESKTKSKNRQKIVDVAKKLFTEKSIALTTIADIVQGAEIERQTFYNYFEDKDELATYLFELSLKEFYSEGFEAQEYESCKNGYEMVEKYLHTLIETYFKYYEESLYLVHYDYYYRKGPDTNIIFKVYEQYNVMNPGDLYIKGVSDGSIRDPGENEREYFHVMNQCIGAYANRVLFRGSYNEDSSFSDQKNRIFKMVELYLESMKN